MRRSTFPALLLEIFRAVGGANQALIDLKQFYSYKEYAECIQMMTRNKIYSKSMTCFYEAKNVNELINESLFPILVMEKKNDKYYYHDLRFMLSVFETYKSKITSFLQEREKFESFFLNGKYSAAMEILENIYQICGLSFWYIESKLLLLNKIDYSSYNNYYKSVRDVCQDETLKSYIRLLKRKVNMRTRQMDFIAFYKENFGRINLDEPELELYTDYVEYMQFERESVLNTEKIKNLVCMMHHLTIADAYLLFEKLISELIAEQKDNLEIENIFEKFSGIFCKNDYERGQLYHKVKMLFCEEKITECQKLCEKILKEHGNWFEILDIYIKVLVLYGEKPENAQIPLQQLTRVLFMCYLKEDESEYGSNFLDLCDRYLRALGSFSSYYELLNIVVDSMYVCGQRTEYFHKLMVCRRTFDSAEEIFYTDTPDIFYENYVERYGILCICDWSWHLRNHEYIERFSVESDEVFKELCSMDRDNDYIMNWDAQFDNKHKIYYEEYIVSKFRRFCKQKRYMDAIHLYVDAFVQNNFLTIRLDHKRLNDALINEYSECELSDLDFFIYANITDFNKGIYGFDIMSQTVVDSFASILESRGIKKPSDIIGEGNIPDKRILIFWDFCCSDILMESPCDLYSGEMYEEQVYLLNQLVKYTDSQIYREKRRVIAKEYDYFKIQNKIDQREWMTDKIVADWIYLGLDANIISSYEYLKNYSIHQIAEQTEICTNFRDVFVTCKKEYVKQVNKQMGTTIRHGILETEFVRLLKEFDLFIPECDRSEKEKIISTNRHFLKVSEEQQERMWQILQSSCQDLFKKIDMVKKQYIFLSCLQNTKGPTSMYTDMEELKHQIYLMKPIRNEIQFVHEMKAMLDRILTDRLPQMKGKVTRGLDSAAKEYIAILSEKLIKEDIEIACWEKLQEKVDELILKIGEWFNLCYNGDRLLDLSEYYMDLEQGYPEVQFQLDCREQQISLNTIRCIDIILKNLIRNIERHSGYAVNLKEADPQIVLKSFPENIIEICAKNRLAPERNRQEVEAVIREINIGQGNCDFPEEMDDSHGHGYERIRSILNANFIGPELHAELKGECFFVRIVFCFGGEC